MQRAVRFLTLATFSNVFAQKKNIYHTKAINKIFQKQNTASERVLKYEKNYTNVYFCSTLILKRHGYSKM